MENTISRWAVVIMIGCTLGGCAGSYSKDRPYDPDFGSAQLIDQIPNWEGEALRKRACGVPRAERYSWMRNQDCGD